MAISLKCGVIQFPRWALQPEDAALLAVQAPNLLVNFLTSMGPHEVHLLAEMHLCVCGHWKYRFDW